jgi:hypothetical protein
MDVYYLDQKQRPLLKCLQKALHTAQTSEEGECISTWFQNQNLSVNDYLKHGKKWLPLFYYVICLPHNQARQKFCLFLLKNGANIDLLADSITVSHIMLDCQTGYLPLLIRMGVTLPSGFDISKCVTSLESTRLTYLEKNGQIKDWIPNSDLMENCLKSTKGYLMYIYTTKDQARLSKKLLPNEKKRWMIDLSVKELDLSEETNKTITQLKDTVAFIIRHGGKISLEVSNLAVDYYFHEILEMDACPKPTRLPVYHSFMEPTEVALMRPLFNDRRYNLVCRATGNTPHQDLTTSIKQQIRGF